MKRFQPQLSATIKTSELAGRVFPLAGSYKYDGYRAVVKGGKLLSRKLKRIPNLALRKLFERPELEGFDGELVAGSPTAPDCFNRTSKIVTTADAPADGVVFYVFDYFGQKGLDYGYRKRFAEVTLMRLPDNVKLVLQRMLHNVKQVLEWEEHAVRQGYEGIMLRGIDAPYKFGRSTLNEGYLMKLKRTEDSEAVVLKVFPRMKNMNKLEKDERGYAKRSSHKEGKKAMPAVGKYLVRDLKTKKVFKCGTGKFKQQELEEQWRIRDKLPGKILKYRFQPAGVKELPRFPRALGWRSRIDF